MLGGRRCESNSNYEDTTADIIESEIFFYSNPHRFDNTSVINIFCTKKKKKIKKKYKNK